MNIKTLEALIELKAFANQAEDILKDISIDLEEYKFSPDEYEKALKLLTKKMTLFTQIISKNVEAIVNDNIGGC